MIASSVIDLIGHTPILDISRILEPGSARLLAKLEMFNPGGSIKDRPALAMIQAAEADGKLKPGMTIVEPTAGNTGIGLALVGNLKGYATVFFVPDRMSREKINAMRAYGAKVVLIPKERGMPGCIEEAEKFAAEHGNCFIPQQFNNPANPHQAETLLGPEIYQQLGFYPDGLVLGAGTGGTFSGTSRWLRAHRPDAKCWLVQPYGSIFDGSERKLYEIEGIGNSFIPANLDLSLADRIFTVPDQDAFRFCKRLALEVGIAVAGSSGANAVAAVALCGELGPGKTVLTIFPDNMERYYSKPWFENTILAP